MILVDSVSLADWLYVIDSLSEIDVELLSDTECCSDVSWLIDTELLSESLSECDIDSDKDCDVLSDTLKDCDTLTEPSDCITDNESLVDCASLICTERFDDV